MYLYVHIHILHPYVWYTVFLTMTNVPFALLESVLPNTVHDRTHHRFKSYVHRTYRIDLPARDRRRSIVPFPMHIEGYLRARMLCVYKIVIRQWVGTAEKSTCSIILYVIILRKILNSSVQSCAGKNMERIYFHRSEYSFVLSRVNGKKREEMKTERIQTHSVFV